MNTNFALSLSFEGIEMLHRVQRGWKRIGTADVEAKDLDAQLTTMRKRAQSLAPDGLRTKLIIPLDQIKYIAIDSTQTTLDDINATLDGATPYALDDLVIDVERFGGRTHIAAVARETLAEAEAFAYAHGFRPVCFAAIPEPFTFQKEVFFGPTSMMQEIMGPHASVQGDRIPVMVLGTRAKSRLLVFDLPEDELPPADDFDLAAALAPHIDPPSAQDAETPEVILDAPVEVDVPMAVVAEQPLLVLSDPVVDVAVDLELPAPETTLDTTDQAASIVDASIEEVTQTFDEGPAVPVAVAEPELALDFTPAAPATLEPQPAPRPAMLDRIIAEYRPPVVAEIPTPQIAPEPELLPEPAAPVVAQTPVFFAPSLMDRVIAEVPNGKRRRARKRRHLSTTAPTLTPQMPKLGAPPEAPVNRAATPANTSRRPMVIAGAVAASLVLVGAVAWSAFRDTGGADAPIVESNATTGPVETPITTDVTAAVQTPAPQELVVVTPPASVTIVAAAPTIPQIDIAGFSVDPDTAAATPGLATLEEPAAPALRTPAAVVAPDAADAIPSAVQPPPVAPVPAPVDENVVVAEAGTPVLPGTVLSPAEAQTVYAATGVWQRAPRFVDLPTETSTDGLIVPFSESPADRVEQPQVPAATDLATDLSFLAPADPPAAEVQFPVDENGFIRATPEGTITPEGAVVFAGLPDLVLRARPELTAADLERMALLAPAPEGVLIVAGRPNSVPPLRPDGAALPTPPEDTIPTEDAPLETAQDAPAQDAADPTAGGVALSALDDPSLNGLATDDPDLRPISRPGSLVPQEDPGTPDITAIIAGIEADEDSAALVGATPQAVIASLRPETRPQNFASTVAAARAAPTPAPEAAPAPVQTAAPVAPQNYAPVPGGVARAATQEDVLPLRQINLIGIYGRPNARRALIRLSNGRYVRVEVGSALDGGQVTAIGEAALNYTKRGRTLALELPAS